MRIKKGWRYLLAALILLGILIFFVGPPVFDKMANKVAGDEVVRISAQAQELHENIWIADLHADALLWNRDLLERNSRGHVDIPRLIEGKVALQAFTIVSKVPFGLNFESNEADSDMITVLAITQRWPIRTWSSLKERALYQSQKLHDFAERSDGRLAIIKSKSELQKYLQSRNRNPDITAGFLGLEGAQVLEGELSNLRVLFDAGFRMLAPSHFFDTEVGGSAHGVQKGGLTPLGRMVIREMASLGMVVDLAHASPQTIDDVLALVNQPVVSSHTGVKGTCDNTRNLSDRHLEDIAATGGVIGIAYFPTAVCGDDVAAIVRAIKYTVELVGVEHVGLGSDFDGTVQTPFDASQLVRLTHALLEAGFSEHEIGLIMGANVRRVLLQVLPD